MSLTIDAIENRIKQYEEEIVKVVSNHTGLTAALGELKQLLAVASEVVAVVVPSASPIVDGIESAVSTIVEVVTPAT